MTETPITGWRRVLWLLPIVFGTGAFVAVAPWLRATMGPQMLSWVAVAFAILVVGYCIFHAVRVYRGLDEVQKAGAMFSAHWGFVAGAMAWLLLTALPPFRALAIHFVRDWADEPQATAKVIVFAMTFGFCGVALLQSMSVMIMRAIWWKSKR